MRDLVSLMTKRRAHIPHRSRGTIERQFGFVGRMSEGGKKKQGIFEMEGGSRGREGITCYINGNYVLSRYVRR